MGDDEGRLSDFVDYVCNRKCLSRTRDANECLELAAAFKSRNEALDCTRLRARGREIRDEIKLWRGSILPVGCWSAVTLMLHGFQVIGRYGTSRFGYDDIITNRENVTNL